MLIRGEAGAAAGVFCCCFYLRKKKEVLKVVLRSTAKNNKTHPLLQRSHMTRCGLAASPAGGAGDAICCICSTGSLRRKKTTSKLEFFFLLSSGGSQWSSSLRDLLLDVAGRSVLQVGQSDLLLVPLTGRAAAQHQAPQGCCRLLHRLILSWLEVRDHHHHRRAGKRPSEMMFHHPAAGVSSDTSGRFYSSVSSKNMEIHFKFPIRNALL